MTVRNTGPVDRDLVQSNQPPATETDITVRAPETPNFATTDVDLSPGSPRSLSAVEPNFATTDVDPTPERPRSLSTAKNDDRHRTHTRQRTARRH
jgi:hypothetical protein